MAGVSQALRVSSRKPLEWPMNSPPRNLFPKIPCAHSAAGLFDKVASMLVTRLRLTGRETASAGGGQQ